MKTDEEQRAYSRGYAAASRRVYHLVRQIDHLKSVAPTPTKTTTIEYLLSTAETLIRAAELLIEAEAPAREQLTTDAAVGPGITSQPASASEEPGRADALENKLK